MGSVLASSTSLDSRAAWIARYVWSSSMEQRTIVRIGHSADARSRDYDSGRVHEKRCHQAPARWKASEQLSFSKLPIHARLAEGSFHISLKQIITLHDSVSPAGSKTYSSRVIPANEHAKYMALSNAGKAHHRASALPAIWLIPIAEISSSRR